ncbi:MAG: hypothetical protein IT178_18725, partial [Acidobacteria bacterium]|nr:hypothetical protein [Acidobacteriota bacterium]
MTRLDHAHPPAAADGFRARLRRSAARHPFFAVWTLCAVALIAYSAWALAYASRWQPDGALDARVFRIGAAEPLITVRDRTLNPVALAAAANLDRASSFVVEWRGLLVADETGTHRLRAQVDDDVAVWVNDVPVIEAQGVSG